MADIGVGQIWMHRTLLRSVVVDALLRSFEPGGDVRYSFVDDRHHTKLTMALDRFTAEFEYTPDIDRAVEVSSIICGTMYKRKHGKVHTVMPKRIVASHGGHFIVYEDTEGEHSMPTAEFRAIFEPLDPSVPAPSAWDRLMDGD